MPPKKSSKAPTNETFNFYDKLPADLRSKPENPDKDKHGLDLPFRAIILGSSGSGKTSTLFNFLSRCPTTFSKIILCVQDASEPLYTHLIRTTDRDLLDVYQGGEVPPLSEYKSQEGNGLIIFDDLVVLSKAQHKPIEHWMIAGRKAGKCGFSMCYLSQSFYQIPKIIRLQANVLILKKLKSVNDLKYLLRDTSISASKEDLMIKYEFATQNQQDFLLIDLNAPAERQFRHNFLQIL